MSPDYAPDPTQQRYGRIAGFAYFFNYVTSVIGTIAPLQIAGSGSFGEKAERIVASEHLYRAALASMTISWVLIVVLAFSLYVTLRPVHKRAAQIALFMELAQACIGAVTVIFAFLMLNLYTRANGTVHIDTLVSAVWSASGSGFQIAMTFLSIGSTIFFYLFYKSSYLPRPLAALGVFGSVLMLIVSLTWLVYPEHAGTLQFAWAPIGIAEVTTALWLMIRGIRITPTLAAEAT